MSDIREKHMDSSADNLGLGPAFVLLFVQLGLQLFSAPDAAIEALGNSILDSMVKWG